MLTSFATCPAKFFASTIMGLTHVPSADYEHQAPTALKFGSILHECLQLLYENNLDGALLHAQASFETLHDDGFRTLPLMECILHYVGELLYQPSKANYEIISLEDNFILDLGLPALYCGRIDLKLLDKFTGQRVIQDWKSTSRLSNALFYNMEKDPQITGYIIAEEVASGVPSVGQIVALRVGKLDNYDKYVQGPSKGLYKKENHLVSQRVALTDRARTDWLWFTSRAIRMIMVHLIESFGERAPNRPVAELRAEAHERLQKGDDLWKYWDQRRSACLNYNVLCQYHQLCLRHWHPNAMREYVLDEWTPWKSLKTEEDNA